MTPAQIRNDVDQFITVLFEEGMALDSNQVLLLDSPGQSLVTWSNETTLSDLFDLESAWDEYIETMRRRWFSVVLWDGAFLQCSYTFSGTLIVKHRLCYFPCPIRFSESEATYMTIDEMMALLEDHELRERIRLEGPLRFDFDLEAGTVEHPAVHLTISRSCCRIPVAYPLSIGHFAKFVFAHFYPERYLSSSKIQGWACRPWDRCLPDLNYDALFVDWRRE